MARIRTVKPELFSHEDLFDAEVETGLPLRLAFIGLFTCCDREGRFKWRPRTLKSNVLPHDDIDFSRVLDALVTRGFVVKYAVDGKEYGVIPTFTDHQVINNRESPSEIPPPNEINNIDASGTRQPRVDHAPSGEGKGKEGKGKEHIPVADAVVTTREDVIATTAKTPATTPAKIPIPSDWKPGDQTVNALMRLNGVPLDFIDQQAAEFLIFWTESRGVAGSWDSKFLTRCVDRWKHHRANPPPETPAGFIERVTNTDWAENL